MIRIADVTTQALAATMAIPVTQKQPFTRISKTTCSKSAKQFPEKSKVAH